MNIIDNRTPYNRAQWQGLNNTHQFISIHYLGVDGQNFDLYDNGYGGHYTIAWNGDIYWSADHNAVLWQVGTAGYYTKKYPHGWDVTNYNSIGIEMCCHQTNGNWWFTQETQQACVELVQYLLKQLGLDSSRVLRHFDIVNKDCPMPYVVNNRYNGSWTWDEFMAKVNGGGSSSHSFTVSSISGGSQGVSVLLLQEILRARGFKGADNKDLTLDRSMGNNTIYALKNYQKARNLAVDGVCGPASWNDLLALDHNNLTFTANQVQSGSRNNSVLLVQEILKARDIYKGELDFSFGNQTAAAVKEYQKRRNLTIDGICGPATWTDMLGM